LKTIKEKNKYIAHLKIKLWSTVSF
jgi:hypothetical protein